MKKKKTLKVNIFQELETVKWILYWEIGEQSLLSSDYNLLHITGLF